MTERQRLNAIKILLLVAFKGDFEGRPDDDQISIMARWALIDMGEVGMNNATEAMILERAA